MIDRHGDLEEEEEDIPEPEDVEVGTAALKSVSIIGVHKSYQPDSGAVQQL
jgi:hypothetical protein